jgi:hypothetical protein
MFRRALTLASASLVIAVPTAANAITVDFDDVSASSTFGNSNPLRDYAGLAFSGPGELDGGAILHQDSNFGVDAHSGTNFLAFNFNSSLLNGGIPYGPERVTFGVVQTYVSIWVAGGAGEEDPVFFLKAYDAADNLVDFDTTTAKDWSQMAVAGENISYVEFYLLESGETDKAWVADDLFYLNPVPEPGTMAALALGGLALLRRRRKES